MSAVVKGGQNHHEGNFNKKSLVLDKLRKD